MKRMYILVSCLALATGCQEEVIVHESNIANEFARMNKNGWHVMQNDDPTKRPTAEQSDPNVRVLREADFSGYQFNTNFQIDDPRYPQTRPRVPLPGDSPSEAPPANPYLSGPRVPGQ